MSTHTKSRWNGAAHTAALAIALFALGCAPDSSDDTADESTGPTVASVELHTGLRELWEEHVQYTRMVIISFAADLPDFDATVGRLLENQEAIGDAIKPFYGEEAGDQLTELLKEHIMIAAEVLTAAKAGDTVALQDASDRWYANGDDIADFLSAANPEYWPNATMRTAMSEHLDTTLAEASARLGGNWDEDIAAYDAAREHVLMMADTLSDGLVAQFPEKFGDDAPAHYSH